MTAKYAVFGHPVAHSLSPRIHAAFARQEGVDMEYVAHDAAPEDFAAAIHTFGAIGGLGANITLPHKERVVSLCSQLSDRAKRAGAVNTLTRAGARWHGDNTDGVGPGARPDRAPPPGPARPPRAAAGRGRRGARRGAGAAGRRRGLAVDRQPQLGKGRRAVGRARRARARAHALPGRPGVAGRVRTDHQRHLGRPRRRTRCRCRSRWPRRAAWRWT